MSKTTSEHKPALRELVSLLGQLPPGRRPAAMQSAASFRSESSWENSLAVGQLRAALADYWEEQFGEVIPFQQLRELFEPPVPIKTVLPFSKLMLARCNREIESALHELVDHLRHRIQELDRPPQLSLFESDTNRATTEPEPSPLGGDSVRSLRELLEKGRRFSTIYADPPWPYRNEASRAAAVNHYPTMSLEEICAEPVSQLAERNAHLHLWTTNAFLQEAFDVMEAWGFAFKSCFVWVKEDLGMGNYWRVSHEFLLFGLRGSLPFRDHTQRSWLRAPRTAHSRKPFAVRELIETVSPPPYLELYGREELPNSAWTVFGNNVESRLC